jgi:hypothetical protein
MVWHRSRGAPPWTEGRGTEAEGGASSKAVAEKVRGVNVVRWHLAPGTWAPQAPWHVGRSTCVALAEWCEISGGWIILAPHALCCASRSNTRVLGRCHRPAVGFSSGAEKKPAVLSSGSWKSSSSLCACWAKTQRCRDSRCLSWPRWAADHRLALRERPRARITMALHLSAQTRAQLVAGQMGIAPLA